MVLVEIHATARRVDDERAGFARGEQHLVHARRHLGLARDGVLAVMQVPHVTHDDRRAARVPRLRGRGELEAIRRLDALLQRELERGGLGNLRRARGESETGDERRDAREHNGATEIETGWLDHAESIPLRVRDDKPKRRGGSWRCAGNFWPRMKHR